LPVLPRRAPEAGIPFHSISVGKLRRYWDWQNVPDLAWRAPAGVAQSFALLRRLKPDLVFATGGFVALPVLHAIYGQPAVLPVAVATVFVAAVMFPLTVILLEAEAHGTARASALERQVGGNDGHGQRLWRDERTRGGSTVTAK